MEEYGLNNLEAFAGNLLNQPEVLIEGSGKGVLGKIINQAFVSSKKVDKILCRLVEYYWLYINTNNWFII